MSFLSSVLAKTGIDQSSLVTGAGTPWAAAPSAPNYTAIPSFNESNYTVPSYSAFTQAGQQQIAGNLANENNQIVAGMNAGGTLNSGDTGNNFSQALQSDQQAQQNLAGQVGQMQYGNALQQYQDQTQQIEQANQQAENSYGNAMQNYSSNKQGALGLAGSLGSAGLLALLL